MRGAWLHGRIRPHGSIVAKVLPSLFCLPPEPVERMVTASASRSWGKMNSKAGSGSVCRRP